jgi:hypothetical protein
MTRPALILVAAFALSGCVGGLASFAGSASYTRTGKLPYGAPPQTKFDCATDEAISVTDDGNLADDGTAKLIAEEWLPRIVLDLDKRELQRGDELNPVKIEVLQSGVVHVMVVHQGDKTGLFRIGTAFAHNPFVYTLPRRMYTGRCTGS